MSEYRNSSSVLTLIVGHVSYSEPAYI